MSAVKSNEATWPEVHATAIALFDEIDAATRKEREQCLEDRQFATIPGAQWKGDLGQQFEKKPRLEVNKCRTSLNKISTEYRNNRFGVVFESRDGVPDEQLADACAALFRSDEKDSRAVQAYNNAFDESAAGGYGAFRLRGQYADEDDEDGEDDEDAARPQRIRIETIVDADISVFFDLNAKEQDKSDAQHCFVITSLTRAAYKKKYGEDPSDWPTSGREGLFDWAPADQVRIAEYYVVEKVPTTFVFFEGPLKDEVKHAAADLDDDPALFRKLLATGYQEVRRSSRKVRVVRKYLLNGQRVIKDCGRVPGRQIPIVPVYGQRWYVDGVERCSGHIRLAKDAQRILNMLLSKLAEICALSGLQKPIFAPQQIAKHRGMWENDNLKNYPYLLADLVMDAAGNKSINGPLAFTKSPDVPPAMAALLQIVESCLRDVLGNPEQAEKMVSHVAGKTVELLQQRIDSHAFLYIDNMALAIRRCAQIWLSMARELYAKAGRKMKGLGERGEKMLIELMKPGVGPSKEPRLESDLTRALFDVDVHIGPSSESKRQAAVSAATRAMASTTDQETQTVLALFLLLNMEGEGVEGLRTYARRRLIRMGAEKPRADEAKELALELQNAPKDPNATFLEAEAEQARADAAATLAGIKLTAAKTDETKAKTLKALADVDLAGKQAAVDVAKSLQEMTSPQAAPDQESGGPS